MFAFLIVRFIVQNEPRIEFPQAVIHFNLQLCA